MQAAGFKGQLTDWYPKYHIRKKILLSGLLLTLKCILLLLEFEIKVSSP